MKHIRAALAALTVLALAACYPPTSTHPVGSTVGIKNDPTLIGTWKSLPDKKGDEAGYLIFMPMKAGGLTAILASAHGKPDGDSGDNWLHVSLTTARFAMPGS